MASKLWIIGDSFWTRCYQRDTKTRLYNASWVDTFATNANWTSTGTTVGRCLEQVMTGIYMV